MVDIKTRYKISISMNIGIELQTFNESCVGEIAYISENRIRDYDGKFRFL